MINLIFAHPYPQRSRAGRTLVAAVRDLPGLELRTLHELYPDFAIDIEAERAALAACGLVIWLHPVYWYSVPGLLKLWFDQVLGQGWAYGDGGTALSGKDCLWVPTTGAPFEDYTEAGRHGHPFSQFEPALRQTARFCGMNWLAPEVLHHAGRLSEAELRRAGEALRERLVQWSRSHE